MNKLKGDWYELFINQCINTFVSTKESYLWHNVPEDLLYRANLITEYNEHRLIRQTLKINPLQYIGYCFLPVEYNDITISYILLCFVMF